MILSTLLSITGVLATIFGLSFLLVPVPVLTLYGIALDPNGAWFACYLGAASVSFGLLAWQSRHVGDRHAKSAIAVGFLGFSGLSLVVATLHALSGLTNSLAWSTVGLYLLLSLGFGYSVAVEMGRA